MGGEIGAVATATIASETRLRISWTRRAPKATQSTSLSTLSNFSRRKGRRARRVQEVRPIGKTRAKSQGSSERRSKVLLASSMPQQRPKCQRSTEVERNEASRAASHPMAFTALHTFARHRAT
uniref:Uncharacterized protein n=1 Tax=Plectus sambesii TaxID=2011161 RepID=A0A914WCE7_9BILA